MLMLMFSAAKGIACCSAHSEAGLSTAGESVDSLLPLAR